MGTGTIQQHWGDLLRPGKLISNGLIAVIASAYLVFVFKSQAEPSGAGAGRIAIEQQINRCVFSGLRVDQVMLLLCKEVHDHLD